MHQSMWITGGKWDKPGDSGQLPGDHTGDSDKTVFTRGHPGDF